MKMKFSITFLLLIMIFQDQIIFGMFVYGTEDKEKASNMELQSQISSLKAHLNFLILTYLFPLDCPNKIQIQAFFPHLYEEINNTIKKFYIKDPDFPLQIHSYQHYWMLPFLLSSHPNSVLEPIHNIVYQSFQVTTGFMFSLVHDSKQSVITIDQPKWTVTMDLTNQNILFVPDDNSIDGSHKMLLSQFPFYTKFLHNDRLIEIKTLKDFKLTHVYLEQDLYSNRIVYYVDTLRGWYYFQLKFSPDQKQHLERIYFGDRMGDIESNGTFELKTYFRTDKLFGLREYTLKEGGGYKIIIGFWVNTE